MKSLTSWLLLFFTGMFWIFRLIVTIYTQNGDDFMGITTLDFNVEVFLLFITLICIVLIPKRSLVSASIYMASYVLYFGQHLFYIFLENNGVFSINSYVNILVDILAILLAFLLFIDTVLGKNKNSDKKSTKTDWYFKEEKYDKEIDERVDKNHYKFL